MEQQEKPSTRLRNQAWAWWRDRRSHIYQEIASTSSRQGGAGSPSSQEGTCLFTHHLRLTNLRSFCEEQGLLRQPGKRLHLRTRLRRICAAKLLRKEARQISARPKWTSSFAPRRVLHVNSRPIGQGGTRSAKWWTSRFSFTREQLGNRPPQRETDPRLFKRTVFLSFPLRSYPQKVA